MRLDDSGLTLRVQRYARIAFDFRTRIVSVSREALISEMIVWIILKTKWSSTFEQEGSFTGLCQHTRGNTATCTCANDDDIITDHSWDSNPIIFQAIKSRFPPLPGSL